MFSPSGLHSRLHAGILHCKILRLFLIKSLTFLLSILMFLIWIISLWRVELEVFRPVPSTAWFKLIKNRLMIFFCSLISFLLLWCMSGTFTTGNTHVWLVLIWFYMSSTVSGGDVDLYEDHPEHQHQNQSCSLSCHIMLQQLSVPSKADKT